VLVIFVAQKIAWGGGKRHCAKLADGVPVPVLLHVDGKPAVVQMEAVRFVAVYAVALQDAPVLENLVERRVPSKALAIPVVEFFFQLR
jgi:hypothetical protein